MSFASSLREVWLEFSVHNNNRLCLLLYHCCTGTKIHNISDMAKKNTPRGFHRLPQSFAALSPEPRGEVVSSLFVLRLFFDCIPF